MVGQPGNGKISHSLTLEEGTAAFASKLSHPGRRINISKNMTFIIPEQMLFFFFISRILEPDLVIVLSVSLGPTNIGSVLKTTLTRPAT